MRSTSVTLKTNVVRRYIEAGVLRSMTGRNAITNQYRQLLQCYRGPQTNRSREVADWLIANIDQVRETMRRKEFARQIHNRYINLDEDVQSEQIKRLEDERQWVFDLTQETERQRKAKEIEDAKELADAIAQEYNDENNAFMDWANYDNSPLSLPESAEMQRFKNIVKRLYENPFDTEIEFKNLSEHDYKIAGEMLMNWFNKCMAPKMGEKILVEYKINKDSQPRRFKLASEVDRLKRVFTSDIMFDHQEDFSGIDSGDNGRLFMEWIDSITFINIDDKVERPSDRRSVHRDGFFPRKLSGNFKLIEPFLHDLQVYASYSDDKGNTKKGVNEACFTYALAQAGIDKDIIAKILSFVGHQKRISRNVWTEIANAFDLKIHLRIYDEKKHKIDQGNQSTKGWYGNGTTEIYLAEYMDHVFIDKVLAVNLFAIKNWNRLCEITSNVERSKENIERMLKASRFDDKVGYKIDNKRANARSLEVLIAINNASGFELINASDKDVEKAGIYNNEIVIPKPVAGPYNQKLHTRRIKEYKNAKTKAKPVKSIYYADFETCAKKINHKNASTQQVPFMLCVCNQDGSWMRTYVGDDMQEQMMNELPDQALIYFHNLGFDGNFFYGYANKTPIKKGSKIMSMPLQFKDKTFTLKDSYSLLPTKLSEFTKLFPNAFAKEGENIKKEFMPYGYYTYERLNAGGRGNVHECIKEVNINETDAKAFVENINMIEGCWIDEQKGDFDMIKYCEFYCQQDVRVLRIGFESMVEASKQDPINMDIHEILTVPSLAYKYLKRNVFYPNSNIYELNGEVQQFIQGAVYGGRCMTKNNLRYKVEKLLDDFDACSLYPSAMARMFTVEGVPEFYEHNEKDAVYSRDDLPFILTHAFEPGQCVATKDKTISQFVVDIKIESIGIRRAFPLIVKRADGKQMNVNECVEMRVDMITLQDLLEFQDITFRLGNGYIWRGDRDYRIQQEIKKLFNLRAEYKKSGNPTQQVIKLIMNSAYGKSIQKPIKTFLQFVKKDEYPWFVKDRYYQIHCDNVLDNGNHLIELTKQKANQFNNVLFGVTVLSMSKRIMNEVMCLAEDLGIEIYYQDTDSMHIERDKVNTLAEAFKVKYNRELIGENVIGCFHGDFDEIKDAYADYHISLGKKMYCDRLLNDNGERSLHYRLKGIPQQVIENHANKHFKGDIIALYEYLYVDGNSINFNLLDGKVCMMYNNKGDVLTRAKFMREVKATCPMADE